MDRTAIGKVLRRERKSRKLTQEVLSGLAGIDRSHLGKLELGQTGMSLETMMKIADALDLPAHKLVQEFEEALEE